MNIRKMIEMLEQIALLSGDDQDVLTFDPDVFEWHGVTCMTYGGGDKLIKLYNDDLS